MDARVRVVRWYQRTALLLLNVFILLVVANVVLYVLFRVKDARTARTTVEQIAAIHESTALRAVYPDMDAESIHQLLRETWSRPYQYQPFTQFKERPFQGRFVNVSENGYRLTRDQGPWPPDPANFNVFMFGGSTTFGYGVSDDQTVPSCLQTWLRDTSLPHACVYNFGRSSYVSGQERALLEQLLLAGFAPDLAVFMDGLNEFAFPDGPAETKRLDAIFEPNAARYPDRWGWIDALPITRLARYLHRQLEHVLRKRSTPDPMNTAPLAAIDDGKYHDPDVIARVIGRYLANRTLVEAVARGYGTRVAFVWQPIPLYKYDLRNHLFATDDFGSNFFARYGYRYMADQVHKQPPGDDFLWCADMQESLKEPLYVDKVHYSARMSRLVASAIGEGLVEHGLLGASMNQRAPTGSR